MNPLALITLLTGSVFIMAGALLRFFPPKKVNSLYGYRTTTSMRNAETWQLANRFAGRLMMQTGLLLAAVGALTFVLPVSPVTGLAAGIGMVVLTVFLQFHFTEKHLKKHFDEHGNKRK